MATSLMFRHHYHHCMATSMSSALTYKPRTGRGYKKKCTLPNQQRMYGSSFVLSGRAFVRHSRKKIPWVKKVGPYI